MLSEERAYCDQRSELRRVARFSAGRRDICRASRPCDVGVEVPRATSATSSVGMAPALRLQSVESLNNPITASFSTNYGMCSMVVLIAASDGLTMISVPSRFARDTSRLPIVTTI